MSMSVCVCASGSICTCRDKLYHTTLHTAQNHCTEDTHGTAYGKHLGDYRMAHCWECGKHFWNGVGGHCSCQPEPEEDSYMW
jgi:hypothetical protein